METGGISAVRESMVQNVTAEVAERFRTFGGGKVSASNPISMALKNGPVQFAAGVDVRDVVIFVATRSLEILLARHSR